MCMKVILCTFQFTANGLKALTTGCKGLKTLVVNDLPTLDDNGILVSRVISYVGGTLDSVTITRNQDT